MAIAGHPDDIEFMMSGTLLRLRDAGYEIHCMTVANGALGSMNLDRAAAAACRRAEAMAACRLVGAVYHESLCDDLDVFYTPELLARVVEEIRCADPEIILTHGPYDYMEDHVTAGRLAVSGAFCKGMKNFKCSPDAAPSLRPVAVYHAMPHSLTDSLRRTVTPDFYVDIAPVLETKKAMLACHRSQSEWLDVTQGNGAYLEELTMRARYFGKMSGRYEFAEGWIRHHHLGFGPENFDPIADAL